MRLYKILKHDDDYSSYKYSPYADNDDLDIYYRSIELIGFTYANAISSPDIDAILVINIDNHLTNYPEIKTISEEIKIDIRDNKIKSILNETI